MLVFIDCRMPASAVRMLQKYGHEPILCPPHPTLDPAVASHPDMLLFLTDQGVLTHADYALPTCPVPSLPIGQRVGTQYPHDVLLNAAEIGSYLVCRSDATAQELLARANEKGVTLLPVRQGYAKCNLCVVSDHAAITSDASIASALERVGINVLRIIPGHVSLPGYAYGFIGGASGTDGTHVFFCGDLALHPDGERIKAFCRANGKIPVCLCEGELIDVGSLLFYGSATEKRRK